MVRDWFKYRVEEEKEEVDDQELDLVSLLLLHNVDHCVDSIAGRQHTVGE